MGGREGEVLEGGKGLGVREGEEIKESQGVREDHVFLCGFCLGLTVDCI